jgi:cytochrome c-type biogenesis protein CcsB
MNIRFDEALLIKDRVFGFLGNGTFVMLFLSMVMYWSETAFFDPSNTKKQTFVLSAKNVMGGANIFLVLLLLLRWETSGHFPLSNLYESLLFLSWCCTFLHLVLSRNFSIYIQKILGSIIAPCSLLMNAFANFTLPEEMQVGTPLVPALQSNWLMMHVTVMIISYATLIIGSLLSITFLILTKIREKNLFKKNQLLSYPFVPAKLTPSCTNEVGNEGGKGYGTTSIPAFPPSIPALVPPKGVNEVDKLGLEQLGTPTSFQPVPAVPPKVEMLGQLGELVRSVPSSPRSGQAGTEVERELGTVGMVQDASTIGGQGGQSTDSLTNLITSLDYLSYRILGLGFPFLTIGILSGAVWANEAWGSYWSWDPKETWALLTWLVFAIYLHTRLNYNEKGEKPAIIASIGFLVVWFCYLGVNLIGEGLHSYGFFNK